MVPGVVSGRVGAADLEQAAVGDLVRLIARRRAQEPGQHRAAHHRHGGAHRVIHPHELATRVVRADVQQVEVGLGHLAVRDRLAQPQVGAQAGQAALELLGRGQAAGAGQARQQRRDVPEAADAPDLKTLAELTTEGTRG